MNYCIEIFQMYGGIVLHPTCKINYVNMQDNYVDMQVTNLFRESIFFLSEFTY